MAFSESNAEHSAEVSILGLGLSECLDERMPFLDKRANLVSSDVHSIEVSVAIEVFHLFNLQSDLSPGQFLLFIWIAVQISQRYLENTTSQAIGGDF